MDTKTKFIDLPNGDILSSDCIQAVRIGNPEPAGVLCSKALNPRVIVDFVIGDHGNCVVLDCESVEERDLLAAKLKDQLR